MPRFTFPVPGRRRKQVHESVISPPLNKVQRFLGAADINVDVDAHQSRSFERPRNWDTVSCISITLPESNTGAEDRRSVALPPRRPAYYDEDSDVLPGGMSRLSAITPGAKTEDDASSVRRQHSSSTITSFYDKSKVPLGISQQTSSSAMAKGLPPKANLLLDIDGSIFNNGTGDARRTKPLPPTPSPSKHDLSYLLHRRPSNANASTPHFRPANLVSGSDRLMRSASHLSGVPHDHASRPRGQWTGKKAQRRESAGVLYQDLASNYGRIGAPSGRGMSDREFSDLKNLHQHYEQMSFRDTTEPAKEKPIALIPEYRIWKSPEDGRMQLPEAAPVDRSGRAVAAGNKNNRILQDDTSFYGGLRHQKQAASLDYSESVSSRHTRASRSFMDADLMHTSVLSLSSDSEDEEDESGRPRTSISVPTKTQKASEDAQVSEARRPATSSNSSSRRSQRLSGAGSSSVPPGPAGHLVLPLPDASTGTVHARSATNLRTSGTSVSTNSTIRQLAIPPRSSSRTSRTSNLSNNTLGSHMAGSVHEARAITLVPAQGASYHMHAALADGANPEELTPPLSPMSIEFYVRSIRSSRQSFEYSSQGDVATSSRNSMATNVMAVTRQEELLLSALRQKRSEMQKSSIAEQEEQQQQQQQQQKQKQEQKVESAVPGNTGMPIMPRQARQMSMESTVEVQSPQPRSVNFKDFPLRYDDGSLTGSRSEHMYDTESSPGMNESVELEDDCSGSMESYDSYLFPADQPSFPSSPEDQYHPPSTYQSPIFGARSVSACQPRPPAAKQGHGRMSPDYANSVDVHIMDERSATEQHDLADDEVADGVPRPDSPLEAPPLPRKKAVRISAVGGPRMVSGWL